MLKFFALGVTILSTVLPTIAQVPTWCSTRSFSDISFCEDFDRYCNPVPPLPYACDGTLGSSKLALREVWVQNPPSNVCGVEIQTGDQWFSSPPWAAAMTCHDSDVLGFATASMAPSIRAAFGEAYSAVMGTDLNPLVLEFVLNGENWSKGIFGNDYLEMGYGAASAPTDYVLSANCSTCGGVNRRYPIICQQAVPPAGCGPIASVPHYSSIAVGFLAFLDENPCHCDDPSSYHSPYNEHLSFFDGHKWWKLRAGLFPNGSGDFRVRNDENIIKLTIKSTTIMVELTCTDPDPDEYSWCEVPRDYMGPFNSMTVGFKHACKLKGSTAPDAEWDCLNTPDCVNGADRGGVPTFDNIVLHGGMGDSIQGACCYPNATCSDEYYLDCDCLGGIFRGHGTACVNLACPPPFKPDHDMDGDVDMSDFAWFQTCLSGSYVLPSVPCQVADLDNDNDVDHLDLLAFISSLSGTGIPYQINCLP